MFSRKDHYIAFGKWVKKNSYLQIPADHVEEYFDEVDKLRKQLRKVRKKNLELRKQLKQALKPPNCLDGTCNCDAHDPDCERPQFGG